MLGLPSVDPLFPVSTGFGEDLSVSQVAARLQDRVTILKAQALVSVRWPTRHVSFPRWPRRFLVQKATHEKYLVGVIAKNLCCTKLSSGD